MLSHGSVRHWPAFSARPALDPTHHLWRVLVHEMGFLSFKTELVWRNPDELPGVAAWADLLLAGLLAGNAARIPDHLAVIAAAQRHRPTAMSRHFHQNVGNITKIASAKSVNSQ